MFTPEIRLTATGDGGTELSIHHLESDIIAVPLIGDALQNDDGSVVVQVPDSLPATVGVIAWPKGVAPDEPDWSSLEAFYADISERTGYVFYDGKGGAGSYPTSDRLDALLHGSDDPRLAVVREAMRRASRRKLAGDSISGGKVAEHIRQTGEIPRILRGKGGRLYVSVGTEDTLSAVPETSDLRGRWVDEDEGVIRVVALQIQSGGRSSVALYAPLGCMLRVGSSDAGHNIRINLDGSRQALSAAEVKALAADDAHEVSLVAIPVASQQQEEVRAPQSNVSLPAAPPPPIPPPPPKGQSDEPVAGDEAYDLPEPPAWDDDIPDHIAFELDQINEEGGYFDDTYSAEPTDLERPVHEPSQAMPSKPIRVKEIPLTGNRGVGLHNWKERGRSGVLFASRLITAAIDPDEYPENHTLRTAIHWARLSNAAYRPTMTGRRAMEAVVDGSLAHAIAKLRKFIVDGQKVFVRPLENGSLRMVDDLGREVKKPHIREAIAKHCGVPLEVAFPQTQTAESGKRRGFARGL